eukprot:gene12180-25569_t
MDNVQVFKPTMQLQPGIYYIETTCYFPIRESKGGKVLVLNTDCTRCAFPETNALPFHMLDNINVDDHFFDELNKVPKYKLESKESYGAVERLLKYFRQDTFKYESTQYKQIEDAHDNDFKPLIDNIIGKSFLITGDAGTGKTTLINQIKEELDNQKLEYSLLTPKNISALL